MKESTARRCKRCNCVDLNPWIASVWACRNCGCSEGSLVGYPPLQRMTTCGKCKRSYYVDLLSVDHGCPFCKEPAEVHLESTVNDPGKYVSYYCSYCNIFLMSPVGDPVPESVKCPVCKGRAVIASEGSCAKSFSEDQQFNLECVLKNIFGEEVFDDGPKETARRVLKFWEEFKPLKEPDFEVTTFDSPGKQLVACVDIEFSSLCAHHLLPFYGKAHVGYLPHDKIIGLSKIPRLVDFWAKRPQTQERLTAQIAHDLKDRLDAEGVMVVIEARHTCMACRGVRKHNGAMVTSLPLGLFLSHDSLKQEFMTLIK